MDDDRSYSIAELSSATGFDRRTIVYYIQSGLLPKVGRRGPHTRYPAECLTRLQFIRGVRRLQANGQLLTATLAEIRRALALADEGAVRGLLDRGLAVDEVKSLLARKSPEAAPAAAGVRGPAGERRSYGLADAGIRQRTLPGVGAQPPASPREDSTVGETPGPMAAPAPASRIAAQPTDDVADLGQLLRDLELRPAMNAIRHAPGAPEQWTEFPITSRIYLSVRGLSADDAPLAEAVVRGLKRALRARITTG